MSRPPRAILVLLWFAAVAAYTLYPVHNRTAVLETMGNDLANHVRHVNEAGLALREGQVPPLVTPQLDGGTRLPLFQYYSGTSYWLPAVESLVDPNPYRSLKFGIFAHVLCGGLCVYGVCRLLGAGRAAALAAGTAMQVAPFSSQDLYARGSYTEFAALHAAPLVMYGALRIVHADTRRATVLWLCATGLAIAYYVPLHPVQTVLCGALIGVAVAAYALIDRRAGWPAVGKLAAAVALGLAASAWFWAPVLRDYGRLRIVPHGAFLDAGLADPVVFLAPTYRTTPLYPWAPQLGLHFAVAAVLTLVFWKSARSVGAVLTLSLVTIAAIVLFHEHMPPVQRLLRPLQWSYRLLVPATVAGSICVGLGLSALLPRLAATRTRDLVSVIVVAFLVGNSVPYYRGGQTKSRLRNVLAPTWQAPNSTGSYALRGTDYASLNFVRPDGTLNANTDLPIPQEGVRTEVSLVLRRSPSFDMPGVIVRGTTAVTQAVPGQAFDPSRVRLTFVIRPSVGHVPGDSVVRFEAPGTSTWPVEDLTFRATEDDASMVCRVAAGASRRDRGKTTEFEVNIVPGKEGLYQLPVFVLPSNVVTVNGDAAATTPSDNRAMVIVPLKSGANLVKIRTRPDPIAWAVSAGAIVAMVASVTWAVSKRPRAVRNDGSHGP